MGAAGSAGRRCWTCLTLAFLVTASLVSSDDEQQSIEAYSEDVSEAARVAFLIEAADVFRAESLVDTLHTPEHVYLLYAAASPAREGLDQWIRQRMYANVFVAPEPRPNIKGAAAGSGLSEVAARAATRLLDHHRHWDYMLDLPDTAVPILSVDALSRWLAALNGTSLVGSSAASQPQALARRHVTSIFAALRSGSPACARELWAKARSAGGAEAWAGFWSAALLPPGCGVSGKNLLSTFFASTGPPRGTSWAEAADRRNSTAWGVVSAVDAYDAGHKFEPLLGDWWAQHQSLVQWILHALLVKRSSGEQRVREVRAASRRVQDQLSQGRRKRQPPTSIERFLRAADQLSVHAVLSPADGVCKVQGVSSFVLELSDCSMEAEVFLTERLAVTRRTHSGHADSAGLVPCAATAAGSPVSCGAEPTLLRVGTAWDGDAEVFRGFVSIIPVGAERDLWFVLYFLGPAGGAAITGGLHTVWRDSDDEVLFRGGGPRASAGSPDVAWERYLGPTPLEPGTHHVEVTDGSGNVIARREFEVVTDVGKMSSAERLAMFPRYFDLVPEPDESASTASQGTSGVQAGPKSSAGGSTSPKKSEAPPETTAALTPAKAAVESLQKAPPHRRSLEDIRAARTPGSSTKSGDVPSGLASSTPDEEALAPRDAQPAVQASSVTEVKPSAQRGASAEVRKRLSPDEVQKRELAWLRQDVERHTVPKLRAQGSAASGRAPPQSKPHSEEERRRRELAWIRKDVLQHVPAVHLRRKDRPESASARSQVQQPPGLALPAQGQVRQAAAPSSKPSPQKLQEQLQVDRTRTGPPWPEAEHERREQLWIQREAERLRQRAASRRLSKEGDAKSPSPASSGQQGDGASSGQPTSGGAEKLVTTPVAPTVTRGMRRPRLSLEERERREEEWIRRDVQLHVPRNRRPHSCGSALSQKTNFRQGAGSAPVTRQPVEPFGEPALELGKEARRASPQRSTEEALPQAGTQGLTTKEPPPLPSGNAPPAMDALEAAALEAGLPANAAEEVKRKLRNEIPEEVIDRELPWILRDIAVGRRLSSKMA